MNWGWLLFIPLVLSTGVIESPCDVCNLESTCTGTITWDDCRYSPNGERNNCRNIVCEEGDTSTYVLACNQPANPPHTSFEMYVQNNTGNFTICIGDTCVDPTRSGFARSQSCGICTDEDNDGAFIEPVCGPVDCNDDNAAISPFAMENCTNGVDDDCDQLIDNNDTDCSQAECLNNEDCATIDCPALNGTLPGICVSQVCTYDEPLFGCITNCSDLVDNDNDGRIDIQDPGCANNSDTDERDACMLDEDCTGVCADGDSFQGTCIDQFCTYDQNACVDAPVCGNGIVESGESCDDGNDIRGDGCSGCAVDQTSRGGGRSVRRGSTGGSGVGPIIVEQPEEPIVITLPEPICDWDKDGYVREGCAGTLDCNDRNASINPGMEEQCNGIDDNCNNIVDEGCTYLNVPNTLRVPLLSVVELDMHVDGPLENASVYLELEPSWTYPERLDIGTVYERTNIRVPVLVSESLTPTVRGIITVKDGNHVVDEKEILIHVMIPEFAVRAKPGSDTEVYVIVQNPTPVVKENLEVELNVNRGKHTEYVQYLDTFSIEPYGTFRYRYEYPVLDNGTLIEGTLLAQGSPVAWDSDTVTSVYHTYEGEHERRLWR